MDTIGTNGLVHFDENGINNAHDEDEPYGFIY